MANLKIIQKKILTKCECAFYKEVVNENDKVVGYKTSYEVFFSEMNKKLGENCT